MHHNEDPYVQQQRKNEYESINGSSKPTITQRIFRPIPVLFLFFLINFMNYFDRGVIGAVLSEVEQVFELSNTQSGMLAGSFMIGYMIASPVFAQLSHSFRPSRLMTIGLILWLVAALGCAFSPNFWVILSSRALFGVGEASFAGLAPTYIDDIAPPSSRTSWLSLFYTAIAVGVAVGYIVAGFLSSIYDWRLTFIVEGILIIPFIIITWFTPHSRDVLISEETKAAQAEKDKEKEENSNETNIFTALGRLATSPVFVLISLGYSSYTFVLGALSFWTAAYVVTNLELSLQFATLGVGAVTAVTGLVGTASGGWIVDKITPKGKGKSSDRALLISWIMAVLAVPLAFAAFLQSNYYIFFAFVALAQYCIFFTSAPINASLLSSVPTELRSLAMSMNIFIIHLLGDFPSPILVGLVSDWANSKQVGMLFLCVWMSWTGVFWFWSWRFEVRGNTKAHKRGHDEKKGLVRNDHLSNQYNGHHDD